MEKKNSHVAMEKNICLATGKEYETGSLLLATRYRQNGESVVDLEGTNKRTGFDNNITGNGFCPEVQKKLDNKFFDKGIETIAFIDEEVAGVIKERMPDE